MIDHVDRPRQPRRLATAPGDHHIARMRSIVITLRVVAVLLVVALAYGLGRQFGRAQPAPARVHTLGGSVTDDSSAARRTATLARIAQYDTYLPAMLSQDDSLLRRWPNRTAHPLNVYLADGTVRGYDPSMRAAVERAFQRWERVAEIPVRFVFVDDSTVADVKVHWVDEFPIHRTGQADITWNGLGWIVRGTLTLATHTNSGWLLDDSAVYTVALHEIGHLLGLGHSDNPDDVMYPSTEVHDITLRDRQTAQLLYALPPGSLKHH